MVKAKRQEILKEASANHRQSLIRSLQHRLEVARANGDDQLVRQLEQEAKYLHLD